MRRLPLALAGAGLLIAVVLAVSGLFEPNATAPPPSQGAAQTGVPADASDGVASGATDAPPTEGATASPTDPPPSATPGPPVDAMVVPVIQFRSSRTATDPGDVRAVLDGTSERYAALELVADEADAILGALGVERPADESRLVLADTAADLRKDLAEHRDRLAFLRAEDVTPEVRALAWEGTALFGNDRVTSSSEWPLIAVLPGRADAGTFDPAATWTLFAGGDILLDRGVHETIHVDGRGVDFPFDGGTAEITSRCKDCSVFGWDLPRTRRTGNEGVVREVISGADIAIANLENPVPDRHRWHTSGTVFAGDVRSLDGLVDAGIDYVGLANNHIGDAGRDGILQTIDNLEERGLAYSGAGEDEAAARTPAMLEAAGGTTVAILAYDRIARYYFADDDTPGSAPLSTRRVTTDIRKAREAGADVVIVFPHWGVEYAGEPFSGQQGQARAIIEAGADMIIGNHAHWAAALEIHEGKPIWYALGNFVFDQTWSEPTMEGITLELTFHGGSLAQIRMRPHIILDKAQPNFLDPGRDGRIVMNQVYGGDDLLPW